MILYFVVIDMNWWPIIDKLAAIFPTVAVENCMFYAVEYLSHLERCVDISTVYCTYCAEPGCSLLGLVKGKFNLLENETKLEISRIRKWRKLGEFYRISWILRRRRKLFTESLIAWFYYHLEYFIFCVSRYSYSFWLSTKNTFISPFTFLGRLLYILFSFKD